MQKLLGVHRLPPGTAEQIARVSHGALLDWLLKDAVCGMSFDMAAIITGRRGCGCVVLEEKLGMDLL